MEDWLSVAFDNSLTVYAAVAIICGAVYAVRKRSLAAAKPFVEFAFTCIVVILELAIILTGIGFVIGGIIVAPMIIAPIVGVELLIWIAKKI